MKIYAISGLGADERVFKYLKLEAEVIPIKWLHPFKNESISSYAIRMAECIDKSKPYGIMGVSFGGLICVEINKQIKPSFTILISSVEVSKELPYLYRIFGRTGIIQLLPYWFFDLPKKLAHYVFGTKNVLLDQILDDTDLKFTKWALEKLLAWKSEFRVSNCLKIGGSKDKLLPPKDLNQTEIIEDGGHFMIVDKADEISAIINSKLL